MALSRVVCLGVLPSFLVIATSCQIGGGETTLRRLRFQFYSACGVATAIGPDAAPVPLRRVRTAGYSPVICFASATTSGGAL
jgi:hypothetical protein